MYNAKSVDLVRSQYIDVKCQMSNVMASQRQMSKVKVQMYFAKSVDLVRSQLCCIITRLCRLG